MRDFNEFLESISAEDTAAIMEDANTKAEQIRQATPLSDKAWLGNQIGIVSYTIALELLGLYHKWLDQDSQNLS